MAMDTSLRFYHAIQKNGKFGFVDNLNTVVSPCQWDDFLPLWGYSDEEDWIDTYGQAFDPLSFCFSLERSSCRLQYWLYGSDTPLARVKYRGKWGIISVSGQMLLPCEWDHIGMFCNYGFHGFAYIIRGEQRGILKEDGKIRICGRWNCLSWFPEKYDNHEELRVMVENDMLPNTFTVEQYFGQLQREAFGIVGYTGQYGVISAEGAAIIPRHWDRIEPIFPGRFPTVIFMVKKKNQYGILYWDNTFLTQCQWDEIKAWHVYICSEEIPVFMVRKNHGWGIINHSGVMLSSCQWEECPMVDYRNRSPYFIVRKDKKWGSLDLNGNQLSACTAELLIFL